MTTFDGAVIQEQGVTFGLLTVKQHVLRDQSAQRQMRGFGTRVWGRVPIVLMAQDPRHADLPRAAGHRAVPGQHRPAAHPLQALDGQLTVRPSRGGGGEPCTNWLRSSTRSGAA